MRAETGRTQRAVRGAGPDVEGPQKPLSGGPPRSLSSGYRGRDPVVMPLPGRAPGSQDAHWTAWWSGEWARGN